MPKNDPILSALRQRVAEQQARWQETRAGHLMTWQAADQMIDAGRRAVVELETYSNPPVKRERVQDIPETTRNGPGAQTERERILLHELGF